MTSYSKYWRPKRGGRNVWLIGGTILMLLGVLDLNNVITGDIPFTLLQLGLLCLIASLIEDLRYRFYRKFEQAEDEAAQETEGIPTQR